MICVSFMPGPRMDEISLDFVSYCVIHEAKYLRKIKMRYRSPV